MNMICLISLQETWTIRSCDDSGDGGLWNRLETATAASSSSDPRSRLGRVRPQATQIVIAIWAKRWGFDSGFESPPSAPFGPRP